MTSFARTGRPGRYSDIEALPENVVGELLAGELHVSPRPALRHAHASSSLGGILYALRPRRGGTPGGWWIYDEPELHLGEDVVVPDLAGWRVERLPTVPDVVGCTVAPDWVCEVLSPSTQRLDRVHKVPIYAAAQVGHCWLIDPANRVLEVFALVDKAWMLLRSAGDDDKVRAAPFEEMEIDLRDLWAPTTPP